MKSSQKKINLFPFALPHHHQTQTFV